MIQSLFAFISSLLIATSISAAPHVHTHGEATLRLVRQADTIQLTLTIPADALVGFEHAPKTEAQIAAVAAAKTSLSDELVTFYEPHTRWRIWTTQHAVSVEQVALDVQFHADSGHADFEFEATYRVAKSQPISSLSTQLFSLVHIDVINTDIVSGETITHQAWTSGNLMLPYHP